MTDRIIEIVKATFDVTDVSINLSQKNCERWDSINHLNLVVALEAEFDVSLEPEEIADMKTLDDIKRILSEKF